MTFNLDPGLIVVGIAIFGWIFRVDRKITKLETWFKSCKTCRQNVHPNGDEKEK